MVKRHPMSDAQIIREALRKLADAADAVGVRYFDTDTLDPPVQDMQTATQHARAVLAAADAGASDDGEQFAWVIERHIHSQLYYWTGRNSNDWNSDHRNALRFARRSDAELMLTYHCEGVGRVVEHGWLQP